MALSEGTRSTRRSAQLVSHENYAGCNDVSATFARVPIELKLMFAEQLGIPDVNALAKTCRKMNGLLTWFIYRRATDLGGFWDRSYFLLVVDGGNLVAVERFVEVGASVNMASRNVFWDTAMHSCAKYGQVEIAEFLIDNGINVSAVDWLGDRPLHSMLMGKHPKEAMMALLGEAGDDMNARQRSQTPLHMAATGRDVRIVHRIVQRLFDLGADPNATDREGAIPLHLAAAYANAATVRCLLEAGGKNVEIADNDGRTPLHYAARFGMTETVELLLEMGADVSSVDGRGWTPLHGAVYSHGNKATVRRILLGCVRWGRYHPPNHMKIEMLLAAGADIRTPNNNGGSPLSWAKACYRIFDISPEYLAGW